MDETGSEDKPSGAQGAAKDPLHGMTLEKILLVLVEQLGWSEMGRRVRIKCFTDDPCVPSSLKFLRRNPWAREKVERMYRRLVTGR